MENNENNQTSTEGQKNDIISERILLQLLQNNDGPDGVTAKSMGYCDQAGSCMSELVNEIKGFFAHLF